MDTNPYYARFKAQADVALPEIMAAADPQAAFWAWFEGLPAGGKDTYLRSWVRQTEATLRDIVRPLDGWLLDTRLPQILAWAELMQQVGFWPD